ncbi:MAG: family 20 glycosylhydrolase [Pirellulales bacterium]|nr:family 20 glycosylhydrolase [Pirellulales bacterium]
MFNETHPVFTLLLLAGLFHISLANEVSRLRLVPFPKQIELQKGVFALTGKLVLEAPDETAELFTGLINGELHRASLPAVEVCHLTETTNTLRISCESGQRIPQIELASNASLEGYALEIHPDEIICSGTDSAGLFFGVQTLCQLIRANRIGNGLPCLKIRDWPSLRWRCFQDDLTRGPSSTLRTLKRNVDLGAGLKMNLFTYYMEYQFAFKKHPRIGPANGSLTPEDLSALVEYSKPRHVDILGNQQSFGHLAHILKHEEYAPLRETGDVICPTREDTYLLLNDLYSEVCPLLPFEMFNVCCDETWGLGTGPSKTLADQIGVGGVYVQHIRRVHGMLKYTYGKRMMMWGDIILQHPDKLDQIPKDTVMLTWGYDAAPDFEHQIDPFAESGYEFFVCPGISNWSRILPDFSIATTNIFNFVRDGAKHKALGMLNTAWEDDGEALKSYNWYGYAWGAECAWNASSTSTEEFNQRIGAVLFGEPGFHFGQAITLLGKTHPIPGMNGMFNSRFWENDFQRAAGDASAQAAARHLLEVVEPAIEHLLACKKDATSNAELLDAFLLGARRMERIGLRVLDGLRAAEAYTEACETPDRARRLKRLEEVRQLIETNRQSHAELGKEFERIWLEESKPYALDWTLARYENLVHWYADLAARVADAHKKAAAGEALPAPEQMGFALP